MSEPTSEAPDDDLPEQMRVRRDKRARLLASGQDAYAVRLPVTHAIADLRRDYPDLPPDSATGVEVGVAGRVIFQRNTGKLCFATLRAGDGSELQAMLSVASVGEECLDQWKQLVDIGDHVFVAGEVITSRRGELSVLASQWRMATKSLRPLPVAHKPLSEETRVRQRYVDLIMRPEAREMARLRVATEASIRMSLTERGYLEIETPILQVQQGGAAARPFVTRSHAFDMELYLRIAPELFLKRALVGGLERVFEINRNFRNEGADSTHSPEYVALEFYEAYADYRDMARTTREIIQEAALRAVGTLTVTHADGTVHDLSGDWAEADLYGSTSEVLGRPITPDTPVEDLAALCREGGLDPQKHWVPGKYVEELFELHVVPTFTGPTFVFDYPEDTSPLTRHNPERPGIVEKWDLYINGYEQATGYSELADPVIQRERLQAQAALSAQGDDEAMPLDEDFLRALEVGMPPAGGVGIGLDRLLMSFTGRGIRETILFPLVKPESR